MAVIHEAAEQLQAGRYLDAGGAGVDLRTEGCVLDGSDEGAKVTAAIARAKGYGVKRITVDGGTLGLADGFAFDSDVELRVGKGALIRPLGTATINGPFAAGLYKVFDTGAGGSLSFGKASVERFLPQWWGATGDGSTDDTAAIQAAIDAATAGQEVYVPVGTYKITAPVIIPSTRTVRGAGMAATTFHWYGGADSCIQVGTQSGEFESTVNVTLSDFNITIPTNASTVSGGVGLDLRSSKWNSTYSRIRIGDNSLRAFDVGLRMGEFTFINNFYHIVSARNLVGMEIGAVSNTNFFYGGSIMNGTGIGVKLLGPGADPSTHPAPNNWSFFGTNFEGNAKEGLRGEGTGNLLLTGCRLEGNNKDVAGGAQLYASNANIWTILGNWFSGNNAVERAIDLFNSSAIIEGNREINHTTYFVSNNTQNGKVRVKRNHNTTGNQVSTVTETEKEYAAKVRGSTQAIADGGTNGWQKADFSVTLEDNDLIPDLANNELVFRRSMSGVVSFYALFATNATGMRLARLQRNRGGTITTLTEIRSDAQANTSTAVGFDHHVAVQNGDKLYVEVYQNSGAGLNLEYYADWSLVFGFRATHVA